MAQLGRFFDGPQYGSQDFAQFFTNFLSTGFFTGLEIQTNDSMTVTLKEGSAFVEGHEYRNTSDLSLTHETASATDNRIDRIVIRLDRTPDAANPVEALVRKGVASATPEAPVLVRDTSIWEISLAQVLINAASSVIASNQITDERGIREICGRVGEPNSVADQVDSVDVRGPGANASEYTSNMSRFYLSGNDYPSIMQAWLDSIGVSPSDYGRTVDELRAYVQTTGNRTNTGTQEITIFDWSRTRDYKIYGVFRRACNAISNLDWGVWAESVFVIEEGENTNGNFIKKSNGELLCWAQPFSLDTNIATGAIFRSESQDWVYPATFDDSYPVVVTGDISSFSRWMGIAGGTVGGQVAIRALGATQTSTEYSVYLQAIGRWR